MNATRAKKIAKFADQITGLKESLEAILEAEQEFYDKLSEKQQEGDKGTASQEAIEYLEAAISSLEDAADNLGNVEHEA